MPSTSTPVVSASLLAWIVDALGKYAIVLPVSGLICFLLVLFVVCRGKGSMAAASLILIVHIPLFIGLFAALVGGMRSYTIIAASETAPKPAYVAQGFSTALAAPIVGILMMVPAYLTAVIGGTIRSLSNKE